MCAVRKAKKIALRAPCTGRSCQSSSPIHSLTRTALCLTTLPICSNRLLAKKTCSTRIQSGQPLKNERNGEQSKRDNYAPRPATTSFSVSLRARTQDVQKMPSSPERTKQFRDRCYEKLPFALPSEKAQRKIADREGKFADELFKEGAAEPISVKRKLRDDSKTSR